MSTKETGAGHWPISTVSLAPPLRSMGQHWNMTTVSASGRHVHDVEEPPQLFQVGDQQYDFNIARLSANTESLTAGRSEIGVGSTLVASNPLEATGPGLEPFIIPAAHPEAPTSEVSNGNAPQPTPVKQPQTRQSYVRRPRAIHAKLYACGISDCGKTFTLERDLARHQVYSQAHKEFRSSEAWFCHDEGCKNFGKSFTRRDNYQRHVRSLHAKLGSARLEATTD
ncbi:hypothetical protein TruAng_009182 [Truncatella angustata]|nr:hypothetical protein TruAng_009182 [Truncatella angustata]